MDIPMLQKTMLFRQMNEKEIKEALTSLSASEKSYEKGETVLYAGKVTDRLGLVLDGSVTIESNDIWGKHTVLSHVSKGQFFAETYALLENEPMMVDVTANQNCRILFLRIGILRQLITTGNSWTQKLVASLLTISVHKNLLLSLRNFHTSPKSIRGRVLAYLNSVSLQKGTKEFDIPFDRQQLADYLNLDRTALSKELGKMRDDGIISVKKNHFILHFDKAE